MGVGLRGAGWLVAMLGVGVMWRMRDVNQEGIVQCTKRYCTILRKLKNRRGRGEGQYLNPKHSQCILKK